ncbi:TPA: glycosyltransferase [Klebsiella pneumoniae]|uniref:glycosyltransferase n=1 Tax=Klebsiella pneumoniae TaxID=573 RepID=UPI0029CA7BB3|nr:glycosyltransferase [Klebsiella pneumoniae]WPI72076.1 glycosyltransferase [Klebsiella pneumoniae]
MEKNIVLISTADWDNPFWTNKQHVAMELSRLGYRILYIDSLGLRAPSLTSGDTKRIINRIKKAIKMPVHKKNELWVWSPLILPWHKYFIVRKLNEYYLNLMIKIWCKKLGFKLGEALLLTYNPITTELTDINAYKKVVYHCVDEIKEQPGMPMDFIEHGENNLLKKADCVFVTSKALYENKSKISKKIYYQSNVADFNHFNKAVTEDMITPSDMEAIGGFRIIFIGAISSYKVDFDLLAFIASERPDFNIFLIGRVGEGDPNTTIEMLKKHKNIYFLGPKEYKSLPAYLQASDVAILPNRINKYTDNMFPMKFFEYLAAGISIVGVKLKALEDFEEYYYSSESYSDFLQNLDRVSHKDIISLDKRLSIASKYTYQSRTEKMISIIDEYE